MKQRSFGVVGVLAIAFGATVVGAGTLVDRIADAQPSQVRPVPNPPTPPQPIPIPTPGPTNTGDPGPDKPPVK